MARIGLYFGTFDPPHLGHTIVAEQMLHAMDADEVWMVVSPHNPFKEHSGISDESLRLAMVEAACADIDGLSGCDVEFDLDRPSYTIDTLRHLDREQPEADFFLIMGSDNIIGIDGWKESAALLRDYPIAVYPRPGYEPSPQLMAWLPETVRLIEAPEMSLSSTLIRQRIPLGEPYRSLLRPAVADIIESEDLYL